ncbi:energy-coupling factor transporter ATPase [Breznakiella homolactica]|uniref:ATP-binding cassette domain-containing protein n=1 Tax=Breznakiella homolactica TaxID=2798577 RepID=A0A7T7XLU2_9SPIR|nr:energy-coupling factor transporter ATPase [Breznakiella homolactica]QQO08578.1 ATP-binding cassette domain-containing protein [Breznakiella homolactica]
MDGPGHSGAGPLITITNLSYTYEQVTQPALSDISLSVFAGERIAVLGSNGSGKSTLLSCLNGRCEIPPGIVSVTGPGGTVLDPGIPSDLGAVRKILGTVLQNPDDQIVSSVVEEDVAFGPENLGIPEGEVWERVSRALKTVQLEHLRSRPPQFLSGGEKQRLAVAGILALETDVIALDEATSMIDPAGRETFLSFLDILSAEGKTILQVTHSLEEAFRCPRCIVLHQGRLVFDGGPEELLRLDSLESWGFRLPESFQTIRGLAELLPGFSVGSPDPAETAAAVLRALPPESVSAFFRKNSPGSGISPDISAAGDGAAVDFSGVSHRYLAGTAYESPGISDVTFAVPENSSVACIGPSGSGKSTLMKHINALLLPSAGIVSVFGCDTADTATDLRKLRFRAVLGIQNPESALYETYVADDVAYGPRNAGLRGAELLERVTQSMEKTGLSYAEYGDRETRGLSGGEKRRAALAGVLALDSDLVILDEPYAALDGNGKERVSGIISGLRGEGRTVFVSTHSMEQAAKFDFVAVMLDGRLAAFGPPREIFGTYWKSEWDMRLPWVVQVFRALCESCLSDPDRIPLTSAELLDTVRTMRDGENPGPDTVRTPRRQDRRGSGGESPCTGKPGRGKKRKRSRTGIEFFRNTTLGQFLDRPSFLRNLGAGIKLILALALSVFAVAGQHPLFPISVLCVTLLAGTFLASVGPKHLLRGIIPALPYILLIVIIQLAFSWANDESPVLFSLGMFSVTANEVLRSVLLVTRLIALMAILALYSAVTPLREFLRSISRGLRPFGKIGLPVRDVSLAIGITFRFVPILTEEAERIVTAQLSRGGGYTGKGRLKAAAAMVVPLFLRALERSLVLAQAMELRLFGGDGKR